MAISRKEIEHIAVQLQKQLLHAYGKPLICLTLNIPGPVKLLPGTSRCGTTFQLPV